MGQTKKDIDKALDTAQKRTTKEMILITKKSLKQ